MIGKFLNKIIQILTKGGPVDGFRNVKGMKTIKNHLYIVSFPVLVQTPQQ
jgi:hypothetical protein